MGSGLEGPRAFGVGARVLRAIHLFIELFGIGFVGSQHLRAWALTIAFGTLYHHIRVLEPVGRGCQGALVCGP